MASDHKAIAQFLDVRVNKFFNYKLISRSSEEAVVSMEVREGFLQEEGVVQGGILSAIADTAAVYTFYPDLDETEVMTSIEFKVNFLRPALPGRSGPWASRNCGGISMGASPRPCANSAPPAPKLPLPWATSA